MSLENMGKSMLSNNRSSFKQSKIVSKFGSIFKGATNRDNTDRTAIVIDKHSPRNPKRLEEHVNEQQPSSVSEVPVEPIIEAVIEEKEVVSEVVEEPVFGNIPITSGSANSTSFSSGSTNTTSRF